jgi:hypothetical protein
MSETAKKSMTDRDIQAVIAWFKERIAGLEQISYREGIREKVKRLRGFVEVLEGELDGYCSINQL